MVGRRGVVAVLTFLLAFPAWSNPGVIGSATGAKSAKVRGAELAAGTTIFSGDTIEVGANGGAWISIAGGGVVHVAENSQVRLSQVSDAVQLELQRGGFSFRIQDKPLVGRLADATIRSADGSPAVGLVAMLSPTLAIVAAEKGELLVSAARTPRTVRLRERENVTLTLAPDPQDTTGFAGSQGLTNLTTAHVILIGTVAATVISLVALHINANEAGLSQQQKKEAVSPFRFP